MDQDDTVQMLEAIATAFDRHDLDGCDLWTFRDRAVAKKVSDWKIRTG